MNRYFFKTFLLAIIAFCSVQFSAQFKTRDRMSRLQDIDERVYSWGFYLNMNNFSYKLDLASIAMHGNKNLISSKANTSFGAGLILRRKFNNYIDLRFEPGLQFVQRDLVLEDPTTLDLTTTDVKSTYVDLPVLVEFHGERWHNSRPYVAVGGNVIANIQSNSDGDNLSDPEVFRSKNLNLGLSGEIGVQFYFNKFKLTPAFRATFMLNDEMERDNPTLNPNWSTHVYDMRTNYFMFILKFE